MNRARLIGIPTAVAALTLGALASADPASADTTGTTSSWMAFARHSTSGHIYKGIGPTASQAKSKAILACKIAHRSAPSKCRLMQLRKVS